MKELTKRKVASFLLENDNYCILTHRRPDGDTIGCAVALCRGLRSLGKNAWILENPQFTPKFRPYLQDLTTETFVDGIVVAVDIATAGLLPHNAQDVSVDLRIDHHGRDCEFGNQGHVDPDAAACGEIILEILQSMDVQIDKAMAEALYLALSTDTGCFRYSNVTANTLRAAAFCIDCGADTFAINQVMFMTKRLARLKLDAYLAETTQFYADEKVAVSLLPTEIREKLGINEDDIDDISGFARDIEGVEIAAMIRREGNGSKISVRTSPEHDACAICAMIGGGGHKAAAGATLERSLEEAKTAILEAIEKSGVKL